MTELLENLWVQRVAFLLGGLVLGVVLEFVVVRRIHRTVSLTQVRVPDSDQAVKGKPF